MTEVDIVIVGCGAAGIATSIFAAQRRPGKSIMLLDGAEKIGAKILMSGGGRCNVANRNASASDYHGGSSIFIRHVLQAFPVDKTIRFFRDAGADLHEESDGKLFPATNQSRTVLNALVRRMNDIGIRLCPRHRVVEVIRKGGGFQIKTSAGIIAAPRIVLATGGMSYPQTGSDGSGYRIARSLGHGLIPPVPALVPLVLEGTRHRQLAGISQEIVLTLKRDGRGAAQFRGPMLWTHFGISGPAVLNMSGIWHRTKLGDSTARLQANFLPDDDFTSAELRLLNLASTHGRPSLQSVLSQFLPARVSRVLLQQMELDGQGCTSHLSRADRRRLLHSLLECELPVSGSRGYAEAEVTAGGVPLDEINPTTMESRICSGLHFAGEILDVDGRIGGFNFQWAWSSAWVAASAL